MRKTLIIFILLGILFMACSSQAENIVDVSQAQLKPLLEIWFPVVTEADCTLIKQGDHTLLVDCGTVQDFDAICEMLTEANVEKLDGIFISHPHHDHMGSLQLLLDSYQVDTLYVCHDKRENLYASNMWRWAETRNVPVVRCQMGDMLTVGVATLELFLTQRSGVNLNENSGVLRLSFGDNSALLTADIGPYTMKFIHEQMGDDWIHVDLLKFPHHGARALYVEEMNTIDPEWIVISAEKQSREGKKQA